MSRRIDKRLLSFDVAKAVAAVGFLVRETGASMYTVMKMMYLADKLHLENYGQFISGDTYAAMKQGPVPCCTYDLIKHVRGELKEFPNAQIAREYLSYGANHAIKLLKEPALEELSQSDLECLSKAADLHNRFGQWAVRDMSHDGAWRKVWSAGAKTAKSKPISQLRIVEELEDSQALADHVQDDTPGAAAAPPAGYSRPMLERA